MSEQVRCDNCNDLINIYTLPDPNVVNVDNMNLCDCCQICLMQKKEKAMKSFKKDVLKQNN